MAPAHTLRALGPYVLAVSLSNAAFWGAHSLVSAHLDLDREAFTTNLAASVFSTLATHPAWVLVTNYRVHGRLVLGGGGKRGGSWASRGLGWNLLLTSFPAVRGLVSGGLDLAVLSGTESWLTAKFVLASLAATWLTWPLQVARNRAQAGVAPGPRAAWFDGVGWQLLVSACSSFVFILSKNMSVSLMRGWGGKW